MRLFRVYLRALGLLTAEGPRASALVAANAVIAAVLLAEPLLFGRVVDTLAAEGDAVGWLGAWTGLGLFGIVANVVVAIAADRLAHRNRLVIMARAFEHALQLPAQFHGSRGSSSVVRTIVAGSDALFGGWLAFFREQVASVVGIVLLAPVALAVNVRLALLLGLLGLLFVVLNGLVVRHTSDAQNLVERQHLEVAGRLGDVLANVAVVQSFTRVGAEVAELRDRMRTLLSVQYPVLTWWGVVTVLTRAASTITLLAIFATGAWLARRGEASLGEIVSFAGFAGVLISRLELLSGFLVRLFMQAPTVRSLFDLLDTRPEIVDPPHAVCLGTVRGEVRFEHVGFRHRVGGQGVFDLDFVVRPGETVAFVGPTGSGKTTALGLLQRLCDPDEGRVVIDGVDLRDLAVPSLRAAVAVVSQDPSLLRRSIGDNISVGRSGATAAEVEAAAEVADAAGFVRQNAEGFDFVTGERGAPLSGGERQRIAIARAVLKDAPILVLDEATSAVDPETEARIRERLERVRHGRTTFIVAHRLSTVMRADQVFVFDGGRIVERGTFATLLARGGLFTRLVRHEPQVTEPAFRAEARLR